MKTCLFSRAAGFLILSVVFFSCRAVQAEVTAGDLLDLLAKQYRQLEAVQLRGRSATKCPGIADQISSFSYSSGISGYQITKKVGGAEFVQSYDGERSQFYQSTGQRLEILILPRKTLLAYVPHLAAFEWLEDTPHLLANRERLQSFAMWKDRFKDCKIVDDLPLEVIADFPCRGATKDSYYRVRFSKEVNYAVIKWDFFEDGLLSKTLTVKDHQLIESLSIYLPSSVSLAAGKVASESNAFDFLTNSQVIFKIEDLRPIAKDVYDEFEVRDHLAQSAEDKKRLLSRPKKGSYSTWLGIATIAVVTFWVLKSWRARSAFAKTR